ncbi:hypothetical protein SMGD1_0738 [Sulfurimonas gotlandica GD1]|uniref:Uncharacterized protein n=1 Tax=Sulfurimonas gotlandica (strain DSM 19862 / JCM 16533 / GD1) TaxID=929558 RepID=B6BMF7_SULGG|nr:hypothetical protein [Sulfurimonas gotlandica]EDZ61856.1 conserved hypothetical protein [Sulfurimonas gotlandica GD1]EHP29265.1 hypothetical protein SMGD1_0738 [Sulfurimonas gotlandica GD1]
MAAFDWDEYKEFKKFSGKEDKLQVAIDFVKSYYNMSGPREIYNMLAEDDIGQLLLNKRDITDAEGLEDFMFQS